MLLFVFDGYSDHSLLPSSSPLSVSPRPFGVSSVYWYFFVYLARWWLDNAFVKAPGSTWVRHPELSGYSAGEECIFPGVAVKCV